MITTTPQTDFFQRLSELRSLCPEMRIGQLLATIGTLGEDATGHSFWDIDDADLATALEKLSDDLARRSAGNR